MMTLDFRNRVFKKRINDRSTPRIPRYDVSSTAHKAGCSKDEVQTAIEILRRDQMKFWKLNEPILLFLLACICLAVTGFLFSVKIGLLIISIELFVMAFISYERG